MLVDLPTTTEFFNQIGSWSTAMFDEIKPIVFLATGLFIGALFGYLIVKLAIMVFERLTGRGE